MKKKMKISKTFSLDVEVAQLLEKEKNMSAIINAYLRNYFSLDKKIKED